MQQPEVSTGDETRIGAITNMYCGTHFAAYPALTCADPYGSFRLLQRGLNRLINEINYLLMGHYAILETSLAPKDQIIRCMP